jgi:hypothetical protein
MLKKKQILILFLTGLPLTLVFPKEDDESLEKFKIKLSQYTNQKKYEAVILIGNKLLQDSHGREYAVEEFLLNAYQKQIEALISARQAAVLLQNQQILQALKLVNEAENLSPYTNLIQRLKENIQRAQYGLNPLAHLSAAQKIEFQKLLTTAQASLDQGKNEEAFGLFAKTLIMAPKSPEAIEGYNLALVRTNKQNLSGRTKELLVKAEQEINAKKYPEAVQTLDEVLSIVPCPGRAEAGTGKTIYSGCQKPVRSK